MKTLSLKLISCFLLIWLPAFQVSVLAQDWDIGTQSDDGTDPFGGDPFGEMINQDSEIQWDLPEEQQEMPSVSPAETSTPSNSPSYANLQDYSADSYGSKLY